MRGNKYTILITGAAGYIGAILADQFCARDDVESIICIDKEKKPKLLEHKNKIIWIKNNLFDVDWEKISTYKPNIVIHSAWQIRELYGKKSLQRKLNIESSNKVFDFVFSCQSVSKLIYFSSVSPYGAFSYNSLEHFFTEGEPLRENTYLYGVEKKEVEETLYTKFNNKNKSSLENKHIPHIYVVRPAAITGPNGRYIRVRFGLQSALSGQLGESFIHKMVALILIVMPITKKWARQFIHEDDVTDIVSLLAFNNLDCKYEVFNICPPGTPVYGKDMAKAVNKNTITIYPWIIRIAFFLFWHISLGRVPTSGGGWKFYAYPVLIDGSKITKQYKYIYKFNSLSAFTKKKGKYSQYVKNNIFS